LANAIEIIQPLLLQGLFSLIGVWRLGYFQLFLSLCQENFASLLPCELCAKQKSSRGWEFSSADVCVFTNHQIVRNTIKSK